MKPHFTLTATAIAALLCAGPARADDEAIKPKYGHYYNRPGASVEQAGAALQACTDIASGVRRPGATAVGVGAAGLAAGIFTTALLSSLTQAAKVKYNVQNCMVIRGWRLFAMTKAEGDVWTDLPDAQRNTQLAALTGAQAPDVGHLYRVWQNDYAQPRMWVKP